MIFRWTRVRFDGPLKRSRRKAARNALDLEPEMIKLPIEKRPSPCAIAAPKDNECEFSPLPF